MYRKDYLVCERCGINSLTKDKTIPCLESGCEAKVKGSIVTTAKLKTPNKEIKPTDDVPFPETEPVTHLITYDETGLPIITEIKPNE